MKNEVTYSHYEIEANNVNVALWHEFVSGLHQYDECMPGRHIKLYKYTFGFFFLNFVQSVT